MTEKECLQKMEKVWLYLYRNPGKDKADAYHELGLARDRNQCPCCEYAYQQNNYCMDKMCESCLLGDFWPKGGCMADGSAYHVWENSDYLKKKASTALTIYRAAHRKLMEIKG